MGGNPLAFIDPFGLTQADIDNAYSAAIAMMPNSKIPSGVRTLSQKGKAGKTSFFSKSIAVDSKYLECLDDSEVTELLVTILHEMAHFNQKWYEFGVDNVIERITGGEVFSAQDRAEAILISNPSMVARYLANRHVDKESCRCKK